MRLPAALLLLTLTLAAWSPAVSGSTDGQNSASPVSGSKEDTIASNTREKRVFFLPSISASISKWVGLNQEAPAPVTARPAGTTIIYVKRPSKPHHISCKTALSDAGCPAGKVCSVSHTCVPKSAAGASCLRDAQCVSGSCHGYRCVNIQDHCHEGDGSCPPSERCVVTSVGRRCKPKDPVPDTKTCSSPLTPSSCPSGKYCDHSGHCAPQLSAGKNCQLSLQCASGVCRGHVCRSDECPILYSSQYCQDGQFCAPSTMGNECHPQLGDGDDCVADAQCSSRRCERSRCVRHECDEHSARVANGGCAAGEFCMPRHDGNVCAVKRPRGEWCSSHVECLSDVCRSGKCYESECLVAGTDEGCDMFKYCVSGIAGNTCVEKKTLGKGCYSNVECLSDVCKNDICKPNAVLPFANLNETASSFSSSQFATVEEEKEESGRFQQCQGTRCG